MRKFAIALVIISFILLVFSLANRFAMDKKAREDAKEATSTIEHDDHIHDEHHTEQEEPPTPERTIKFQKPIEFMANEAEVYPLSAINSEVEDRNLSLSQDGNTLYFMSNRGSSYSSGDIWAASKIDGVWQSPVILNTLVNTANGEDEPNISRDDQRLYFQSWKSNWTSDGGPYYVVERDGDAWDLSWKNKKGLGGGINRFFRNNNATDGMTISRNEDIFIVAAGNNYDGNLDLYMSVKENGEWGEMIKLDLNTPNDERSAFLADDGKTLYFASNGYGDQGYGKMDIFKTTIDREGKNGDIINIGDPFNSAGDDSGFILSSDMKTAFFVQDGDIFQADLINVDPRILP